MLWFQNSFIFMFFFKVLSFFLDFLFFIRVNGGGSGGGGTVHGIATCLGFGVFILAEAIELAVDRILLKVALPSRYTISRSSGAEPVHTL